MGKKTEKAQIDLIINGATANQAMRDLEAAIRKARSELRGLPADSARFKELSASIKNMNAELDQTRVKAGLVKSSWDKTKESIKASFVGNLGANLATVGLQKAAGYFTDAFNGAVKLSDQMADVMKTTGMSVSEVRKLRTELSMIDTRTSMSELLEIAKVGGQFGIAKDQIYGFVKAVDMTTVALGDEFLGGAEQVATEMSKLRNIFKDIQSDDVGNDVQFISNAINALAAAGVATGPVVSDMANRIGGYGIQIGLTSGQVLGLSATLQELGVSSERGGTAVVRILQKMLTNSKDFAKIAGMELNSFKELLNKDVYGAFVKVMEGSKQLGPNATALAKIVDELEVAGAGASEVFAKLGSNTAMLAEKTALATDSLTNTASITEEFRLKNENLAGSVEQLGKEWNKLTANPAMVSFFETGISLARQFVGGLKELAEFSHVALASLWGESGKVALEQRAARAAETAQMVAEIDKKAYAEQLASYKQHLATMNDQALMQEAVKVQYQQQAQARYLRQLMEAGNKEQFYIELKWAKQLQAEATAIRKLQAARVDAAKKGNDEMTKEEERAQKKKEKDAQRAAEKELKDAQRELDRVYKLQMDHYDDLIKLAEKKGDEEGKALIKSTQEKWKTLNEDARKEIDAAIELMKFTAKTQEEEKAAVESYYLDKMAGLNEHSNQYKLLYEQKKKELADIDKKYADESLKTEEDKNKEKLRRINEIASSITGVVGALAKWQAQQDNIELSKTRKFYTDKKDALKKSLDDGLISQQQYDTEIIRLNEESETKEREMRTRQAESQKRYAVFESAIKAALAWVEAHLFPWKIPQAIAATLQAGVIAAMPIPEFYNGGWMPQSSSDKTAIPIIAHANEYMVDARSARDPFVMDTIGLIERAKQQGVSPSSLASNQSSSTYNTVNNYQTIQQETKLEELIQLLKEGIHHKLELDEEFAFKLNRILSKQSIRDSDELI